MMLFANTEMHGWCSTWRKNTEYYSLIIIKSHEDKKAELCYSSLKQGFPTSHFLITFGQNDLRCYYVTIGRENRIII